jgi:DNA-binding winged helix-turn-helix (wHTH) protein
MDLTVETPAIIEFGRFRIVPHRRELLADSRPVHLGERAFDVLMALIEGQGAVVGKDALIDRVWPRRARSIAYWNIVPWLLVAGAILVVLFYLR